MGVLLRDGLLLDRKLRDRRHDIISLVLFVIAFCDTEDGAPSRPPVCQKRSANIVGVSRSAPLPKRQKSSPSAKSGDTLRQVIATVCIKSPEERPTTCFLCLGNPKLPEKRRLEVYKSSGSLSRHFVNVHIKPLPKERHCQCSICGGKLVSKSQLLNHAETVHGTVSRLPLSAFGPI